MRKVEFPLKKSPLMKPLLAGQWKFESTVSIARLINAAKILLKTDSGYLQMLIRKAGDSENAISFIYKPKNEESIKHYIERTSQTLRKTLGDKLAGWDIATPVWILK